MDGKPMTNDDKDLNPELIKAALEWAEKFHDNIKGSLNDPNCPKELMLACSALQVIIKTLNTRTTPQQPSEPLKELDEKDIVFLTDKTMEFYANNFDDRADAMCFIKFLIQMSRVLNRKLIQPSEKKALSMEDIHLKVLKHRKNYEEEYSISIFHARMIAKEIFDALPAQREVRYPDESHYAPVGSARYEFEQGWNAYREAMKKLNGDKT